MTITTDLHSLYGAIVRWCFFFSILSVFLFCAELASLWSPLRAPVLMQTVDILMSVSGGVTLTLLAVQRKLDKILFRRTPHD